VTRRLLLGAVLAGVLVTGCGVPTDSAPRPIPDDRVPFGLLDQDPTTTTTVAPRSSSTQPR
jgi:hypothetical protein